MGLFRGFVTICFALSKLIKPQNPYKQWLYGVNEKRNAAPARYPLASPFRHADGIPSHLIGTIRCFFLKLVIDGQWESQITTKK